jgi:hypothetical protein
MDKDLENKVIFNLVKPYVVGLASLILLGTSFFFGYRLGYDQIREDVKCDRNFYQEVIVDLHVKRAQCEMELYRKDVVESCPEPADYCDGEEKF